MNNTPKITNGAYPHTPSRVKDRFGSPLVAASKASSISGLRQSLPQAPSAKTSQTKRPPLEPRIPLNIIDAPSQRLIAVIAYGALLSWKLYEWSQLAEDDTTQSFALSLKWIVIDGLFVVGLPELRIPWLELSQPFAIFLFVLHAVFDLFIMFHVQVPILSIALAWVKAFYSESELSVSDHYVKQSKILHSTSPIQGRRVINAVPDGFAALNPEETSICIGGDNSVTIPIHFNSTIPSEVELVRIDLGADSPPEEVIKLTKKQVREIKQTLNRASTDDQPGSVTFKLEVKKSGVYKLMRVIDENNDVVQHRGPPMFVVSCPFVTIGRAPSSDRCLKDLSDLVLNVHGTPPLEIVYSRRINGKAHSFHFPNLQPDGFSSPLIGGSSSLTVLENEDISWARPQNVPVSLNESMYSSGEWQYSVDEVHDGFGNVVQYASPLDDPEMTANKKTLSKAYSIQERPRVHLHGCDVRNPIKVARGQRTKLPIVYETTGDRPDSRTHTLTWDFSPIDTLTKNSDHGDVIIPGSHISKNVHDAPAVSSPGLYTLRTVSAGTCQGEVQEPSSCLVLNPPEPELSIRSREIPDKCAGNSVGLIVDLDVMGTPPFLVGYNVHSGGRRWRDEVRIPGLRFEMRLTPQEAGVHKYTFTDISDQLYRRVPLTGPGMTLEQSVKPAASAMISHPEQQRGISACLEEEIEVNVSLFGDAPFTLEYEIIHDDKRTPYKVNDIQSRRYTIKTPALSKGGEYTLALTSVTDQRGCKSTLQNDIKISVRRQRPKAGFGFIENRRKSLGIETPEAQHNMPLRLTGVGPWTVVYKNIERPESKPMTMKLTDKNGYVTAHDPGVYQLLEVSDSQCPGTVDPKSSTFEVGWLPRPELGLVETESITREGDIFVKKEICEGETDGFEVSLKGAPPYHVKYQIHHKPPSGSASIIRKEFDAALGKSAIPMDTAKSGLYTYTFTALADSLYDLEQRQFAPVVLKQRVNAKPTASFAKPGQVFKLCKLEQDQDQDREDKIPVTLTGVPPFSMELEIKHQSGAVPQVHKISNIPSNSYRIQLPSDLLRLGPQTVRIREVSDARGCQSRAPVAGAGASVQVQVHAAPSIDAVETREAYCVGERIAFTLSGTPPFQVSYKFKGQARTANSPTTSFRRVADAPGEFIITGVSDKASECREAKMIKKVIHPMPTVRIVNQSPGKLRPGNEEKIVLEFSGTPPFKYTYTRSSNARKGQKSTVLETRKGESTELRQELWANEEGTYEVVAIKDAHCAFPTQQTEVKDGAGAQKLLQ